jgi:hypothetical protein
MTLRTYPRFALLAAAFCLSSWRLAPNIVADDVTNAVDAFDRDLGLERIGPDIVNTQPQSPAAETSDSAVNPKKHENHRKSPVSHAPLSADSLSFLSNQRVTDSLRGFMIAKVTQNDMAAIPATEKRFANDALLHRFDRMFSPYGFSSQNLGDTMTGYLIASWEIINNADASRNVEGIRRVREAVRDKLKQKGKVAALSDVEKQRYSEIVKYITILSVDQMAELKLKHNTGGQRQLQELLAKPALKVGIDLRRLRLTDQGFVK